VPHLEIDVVHHQQRRHCYTDERQIVTAQPVLQVGARQGREQQSQQRQPQQDQSLEKQIQHPGRETGAEAGRFEGQLDLFGSFDGQFVGGHRDWAPDIGWHPPLEYEP